MKARTLNARLPALLSFVAIALAMAAATVAGAAARQVRPSLLGIGAHASAFFDETKVHSIYLVINTRDWQSLKDHYLENTYYPCDFKWQDITVRNVGIRSRGTGSRSATKPGLRVDFDRYTTDQTFLNLKSVILRNNTQDASGMHERLSMLLFRRIGVAEAPREAHTRLYVNNEYVGLYTIVESVDKTFLQRVYGENDGYLYKYDFDTNDYGYYFEDRGTDPAQYVPTPFKPETHESDPHPEKIVDFIQIVNGNEGLFRTAIDSYVRWTNFVRHIAVENFIADQDGFNGNWGTNNFYWYRWENSNLFTWIPWDKSEAFKDPVSTSIFRNIYDGAPASQRNRLTMRALGYPDLRTAYLDALDAIANSALERDNTTPSDTRGWLEREIEREYQQIRDATYQDPVKPFTNDEFEQDVERLRGFSRQRPVNVLGMTAAAR